MFTIRQRACGVSPLFGKYFPFQEPGQVKHAIVCAGRQPEGVWVLNRDLIIDADGIQIPETSAKFAWPPIGGSCIELAGKGQSNIDLQCTISLPFNLLYVYMIFYT